MAPTLAPSFSFLRLACRQTLRHQFEAVSYGNHRLHTTASVENRFLVPLVFINPERFKFVPDNGSASTPKVPPRRTFTSAVALRKKKTKAKDDDHRQSTPQAKAEAAIADPNDFSIFNGAYAALTNALKDGLSKLNVGGRLNPETVENLKVELGAHDRKESVKLGDIAQVIPRGRTLSIVAGEREHLKPISTALLGSALSLNAQPDPHNPMQLNAPLPPPTAEARQQAGKAATQLSETALNAVRQARQDQRKILQEMGKKKKAAIDDVSKAEKKLENEVNKANEEVKRVVSDIKKKIERDS